jgi:DNA-directed RNA polymerase subunit RPC12/RpoP
MITVGSAPRPPDRPRADATAKKEPLPKPAAQPGAAAQWYVRTADEQLHGPVTKSQLDALVAEGRLDGFCRVHRGDWDHWKWIEDVYSGFAMSEEAEPEGFADGKKADTKPESRLQPCPDCGKTVSVRAIQCPNCGCPIIPLVTPPVAKEKKTDSIAKRRACAAERARRTASHNQGPHAGHARANRAVDERGVGRDGQ